MKKTFKNLIILFFVYGAGAIFWPLAIVFRFVIRKVWVLNPEDIPKLEPGMLILYNHPDLFECMYEIFLVPCLLAHQVFLHPLKLAPWFTLDGHNFTDKWYWVWLRCRAINICRGVGAVEKRAAKAREMLSILKNLVGLIFHSPEGGRTCTRKFTVPSKSRGMLIGKLVSSTGWLASKTRAKILLIWLENGPIKMQPGKKLFSWPNLEGKVIVKFGVVELSEELRAQEPADITAFIQERFLELADKE